MVIKLRRQFPNENGHCGVHCENEETILKWRRSKSGHQPIFFCYLWKWEDNSKFPNRLESFQMVWKVPRWSGKFWFGLEIRMILKVPRWSGKFPDGLERFRVITNLVKWPSSQLWVLCIRVEWLCHHKMVEILQKQQMWKWTSNFHITKKVAKTSHATIPRWPMDFYHGYMVFELQFWTWIQ